VFFFFLNFVQITCEWES